MKLNVKIMTIVLAVFSICLLGCPLHFFMGDIGGGYGDDTVYLKFAKPSFGGNWGFYINNYDLLRISLPNEIYASGQAPIRFNELMEYKFDYSKGIYTPVLPRFDPEMYYVFKPAERDPVIERIYTRFYSFDDAFDFSFENETEILSDVFWDFNSNYKLLSGQTSTISLTYDLDSWPQTHFSVSNFDDYPGAIPILSEDKHYTFDVNWAYVKEARDSLSGSRFSNEKSINIVVMAEGYNERDIRYFRDYVIDAFQSHEHFHELELGLRHDEHIHVPNDFFKKYWDRINVFMFETISLDSGINTVAGRNSVRSFFGINSDKNSHYSNRAGNFRRMEKVINSTYYKTRLDPKDIDVYIILVNNSTIWAYSWTYDMHIGDGRNGQPVMPVIIQAPTGHSVGDTFFHKEVLTYAIAHELGHAMARLQDEYDYYTPESERFLRPYRNYFRNISEMDGNRLKWQRLIDLDRWYLSPNVDQKPSENNDQKLGYYLNPHFYTSIFTANRELKQYYIPTVNSTMRQGSGSRNYQFGPVNTYHMEGSFRTRMNINGMAGQDPGQPGSYPSSYEWLWYSFYDFRFDWQPSRFE